MDLTLKQIIEKTDDIHYQVDRLNSAINYTQTKNYLLDLKNMLSQVHIVGLKLLNVYNICNNKQKTITHTYSHKEEIPKSLTNDWTYLNRKVTLETISKKLTYDIPVNVKIVKNIEEIPNTPLYWVDDINQYAIHVNGVLLRGNIGNIYNKNHIKENKIVHQIAICKHKNTCRNILNSEICKFYHDPMELIQLVKCKKMDIDTFNKYKNLHRNFLNTSWIYTEMPRNNGNNLMRHFGSRNTLKHEFDLMKINNESVNDSYIDDFRQHCMHDLLVIMGLNQYGLLKEYPDLQLRTPYYDNSNPFTALSSE
jgi:hypothetical protein